MRLPSPRSAFRFFHNLSLQTKAFLASAVLLICLLGLGTNSYVTLTKSAVGLQTLSNGILQKRQAFEDINDAIVATHMKIFRYVSWASNGVSETLLKPLHAEIIADFKLLSEKIVVLSERSDLSDDERSNLRGLLDRWKKYKSAAADTIDVGQTDAPMATMLLGQTDEKYSAVASDFDNMATVIAATANSVTATLYVDAELNKRILAIGAIVGLLLSVVVTFLVTASIVRPITSVTNVMRQLSSGNTEVEIGYRDRRDEIGQMVEAIEIFRQNTIEMRAMTLTAHDAEQRREAERKADMHAIAGEFEKSVQHITKELVQAVASMRGNAEAMSIIAKDTRTKSHSTADIVLTTQENVESVAHASDELARTIEALATQTNSARELAGGTVRETEDAKLEMEQLAEAVIQIGTITDLINGIAQQTNLLALNATIEAARAGDAGKGFAVVAAEVKSLAQQTAKATDEISQKIAAVNASCAAAGNKMGQVISAIDHLREGTLDMATAVGQQAAATQEISKNAQSAADSSRAVATNTVELDNKAGETDEASNRVLEETMRLLHHVEAVQSQVDNFLQHVRAA